MKGKAGDKEGERHRQKRGGTERARERGMVGEKKGGRERGRRKDGA